MSNKNFLSRKRGKDPLELIIEKEENKQKAKLLQHSQLSYNNNRNNSNSNSNKQETIKDYSINNISDNSKTNPLPIQTINHSDTFQSKTKESLYQSEMKYTLQININKKKEQKVKELLKNKLYYINGDISKPKISKREKMMKKGFNFIEPGSFERTYQKLLSQNDTTAIKDNKDNKDTQIASINSKLTMLKPRFSSKPIELKASIITPEIEPWDIQFLPPGLKSFTPNDTNPNNTIKSFNDYIINNQHIKNHLLSKVNLYIQHPIQIKNDQIEKNNKIILVPHLTLKEKKKFRKLKKIERTREEQEKIKLGLSKPKPVKITYKNFMQVFKDDTITDPSQIEMKVKKAYEDRYNKMIKQNEKNKLTKEQRSEKLRRKFERDSKKECRGCLIRINSLKSNKNRFKIDKNGKQLYLTGICLMNRSGYAKNILYFEGGPLAVRRMVNLITRRIKWKETENDEQYDKNEEYYNVIWEGSLKKRNFQCWKMQEIKNEADAMRILSEKGLGSLWYIGKE